MQYKTTVEGYTLMARKQLLSWSNPTNRKATDQFTIPLQAAL